MPLGGSELRAMEKVPSRKAPAQDDTNKAFAMPTDGLRKVMILRHTFYTHYDG
jgi:hypothetical protein